MHCLILRKQVYPALRQTLQKANRRQYNSQNEQYRQAGFGKILFILTPVMAVGGVITYAKYDNNFRVTLEENVPGAKEILKYALQEAKLFEEINLKFESVSKQITDITKSVEDATSTVTNFFTSISGSKAKVAEESPQIYSKPVAATNATKPAPTETSIGASKIDKKGKSPVPVKSVTPVEESDYLPSSIVELEKDIKVAAALAVQEYNNAIHVLKRYNEEVRNVVDQAVENLDVTAWNTLRNKTSARDTSVAYAEKLARDALGKMEKYKIALSKIASKDNDQCVQEISKRANTIMSHIMKAKDELYNLKDVANMNEKYWKNVECARNYFVDEMESIFPGINLTEKKMNLSKEDFDLFIMHAYSHVLVYQKELQKLQTDADMRIKQAVAAFRDENQTEAVKAQIEYHLETEKRKLAIENQKRVLQIRADSEREIRKQLKLQSQAHVDHLNDAIALKVAELRRNFGQEFDEKLSSEKAAYKLQLASMLGKVRGMDAALKARAETEQSAHQAQSLWAACQALWATVRTGEPGAHWTQKLRPLKSEIKAVSKVAEGDELVAVVLGNLPKLAEERGVFPEDALRERFLKVEKIARRVALVPEDDGGLPIYMLSYLQSMFLLSAAGQITKDELEDKPFDFSKLGTHGILNRARYYIDRGDLMQALKYMNLLRGAPRKVASDWLKETRLLLETQQAANTLMAHAAASGLLYL